MNLNQQIRNKIDHGGRSECDENVLIDIHHRLMKEYGWIPLKEFIELPLPTIWNLLDCIKKDRKQEEKQLKK